MGENKPDLDPIVDALALNTDSVNKILATHVADDRNLCKECTQPGHGTPWRPWPCGLHKLATEAALHLAKRRAG